MSGRIPENVVDEVSRRTDILDVVGNYVTLSRKGANWWGLCPFHNEKTPSFSVSPEKNIFYCFGCHKGGGAYQFLMEMESLNFPEAVRRLAEKAGVEIPEEEGQEGYRDNRRALEDLYNRVSHTFRWLFSNHSDASHARDYLQSRGINEETAELYQIGWAPDDGEWLYDFLIKKKYSPDFLATSGLFSRKSPRWSYFVDRLIFPVMPDNERVVAFSGRSLNGREPKYINSPETLLYKKSQQLYGLGQAKKQLRDNKHAIICEGNLDVLSCRQAGVDGTVAPLGTAFTQDQAKLLKRQVQSITLLFDGDNAGRLATVKAAIMAENVGLSVNTVNIPSGSDPSDILCKEGSDSLKKIIENPINIFEYLLHFVISARRDNSGEAQEEALKKLTPYLEAVGSDVRREKYLRQFADEVNADPVTVIREYRANKGRNLLNTTRRRFKTSAGEETETDFKTVGDELYLMTAVAVKTEHFNTLRSLLAPEVFRDRRALSVYRVIDELSVEGRELQTSLIVSKLDDENLKSYILEKATAGIYDDRAEETINEKIRSLQLRILNDERKELQKLMDNVNNIEINNARMRRIVEIDKEIQAR